MSIVASLDEAIEWAKRCPNPMDGGELQIRPFFAADDFGAEFTPVAAWGDLVDSVPKPIIQHGHIPVPDGPGLGFELNPGAVREHLVPWDRGFFAPTPDWDDVHTRDRLWS
jgi:hypothetical protein